MSLWGGRFTGKSDPLFKAFNDSLPFDYRLVHADIAGSICWATAICKAGVITAPERDALHTALRELDTVAAADGQAIARSGHEDVHSWVESNLIAKVGDLGKKLHTGRSRNDQVATDIRLWTTAQLDTLNTATQRVQQALLALADSELNTPAGPTVIPGYTHLQRGQPVLFSHWCLAYVEMLHRDRERFADARKRAARSPLGCGALAGTAFPVDRPSLAADLQLPEACRNSLDAVSDRDFAFETMSACSLCALHLSRLAEDLILYTSSEFAFVHMDDAVTSGSSLMPQKKNPDAMELIRGKAGRIIGDLVALAVTLKGLPLAYNKDMQEDKEPLFDAVDHLLLSLNMTVPVIATLKVDRETCRTAALGDGTVLSTDLADYLVDRGMPFRTAHEVAGKAVRLALQSKTPLHKLTVAQFNAIVGEAGPTSVRIAEDIYKALTLEASLARRAAMGGTSPLRVAEALAAARTMVGS
jgi:argininosuccinate lyase/amino-acid N-acetyltransferase